MFINIIFTLSKVNVIFVCRLVRKVLEGCSPVRRSFYFAAKLMSRYSQLPECRLEMFLSRIQWYAAVTWGRDGHRVI